MRVFQKYSDNGIGYQKAQIEKEIVMAILTACIKTKVCKKQVNDQNNTFYPYYRLKPQTFAP